MKSVSNSHQFEALFNFATIGIIVTDSEGKIINFNKCAESQFGYTKNEILGQVVDVLLPSETHQRHAKYRNQYIHHPEPRVMGHGRDLFAQGKDGKTFPVEVSLSHYENEGQTYVIAFVVDITVRKKHEALAKKQTRELELVAEEIRQMNAMLEQKVEDRTKMLREALAELERSKEELNLAYEREKELNELKSGFVTVASHEFRTPLSTILSSAFLLEKYSHLNPDPKIERHIHRIKAAVDGMKNILEDFLSLGKMEEGLVKINIEEIPRETIDCMLKDMLDEFDGLLKTGQQIQCTNSVVHSARFDKNLVKNILINLISNAIKFTDEHSTIQVSSSINNYELRIAVADAGIGISEDDQQHLFERFFRAKNAAPIQGTGLGLHIVAQYLELMNGRITVQSQLNVGTTVTIFIPQNHLVP